MLNFGTTEIILIFAVLFVLTAPVVIALVIIWLVRRNSQSGANLKQCPFCAEKIQTEAKVCRFCGRDLPV
ncbi:MAG TPA: hypothetical protein VK892_22545 [Pyrinomonadaceae bacterium]|nr:hypothetical protein [Pyrinomonadaceae bacterium]